MEVECIITCNTYCGIDGGYQMSCCASSFESGQTYKAIIDGGLKFDGNGKASLFFEAEILDGSLDGYDADCGVRFRDPKCFNLYFKVIK